MEWVQFVSDRSTDFRGSRTECQSGSAPSEMQVGILTPKLMVIGARALKGAIMPSIFMKIVLKYFLNSFSF